MKTLLPAFLLLALLASLPFSRALAANYTIAYAGNTITVTNSSGTADTLTVSEPSIGHIMFAAPGGTFTGSSTTGTSGSITRNGTTLVVINGGNGGETINLGTLGAGGSPFPSLTINGGTGNDTVNFTGNINFNAGYSLSVNLQSGSASHGADTITVNNNAQLLVTGTGTIDLECSRNISVTGGGILQTTDGNLTVAANQQPTAPTGSFSGVYVDGSTSRVQVTGLGLLSVIGTGGNDPGGYQIGVDVEDGAQILHGDGPNGGNNLIVAGAGGASTGIVNRGVTVYGAGSAIRSNCSAASLSVTGTAGQLGSGYGIGISVLAGGRIGDAGTGTYINGTGGGASGSSSNQGVEMGGTNTAIVSSLAISVSGVPGPGTSVGFTLSTSAALGSSSTSEVTINADSVSIDNTATITSSAEVDFLTIAATHLNLGGNNATGTLGLTMAELARTSTPLFYFQTGSTGDITISAGLTFPTANYIYLSPGSGGVKASASGVDLSLAPGAVFLDGPLKMPITGASADSGYPQLNVAGGVILNSTSTLDLTGTTVAGSVGQTFMIIANDGTDAVSGTFANLPEGAYLAWPPSTALKARISYVGGTGNDVVLTLVGTPTANAQNVTTAFNTAKAITLTASDPNTPALALTYAVTTQPAHGTLSGTAPNLTYTPATNFRGYDVFQFTAMNSAGLTSAAATVSITVTPGTPTATTQSDFVPLNTATAITLTGTDPDSPALTLTYAVTSSPAHGTLSGTAPNLTYTPASSYTGSDSFTFTVSNGTNTSSAGTVNLTLGALIVRNNSATGAGSLVDMINLAASHSGSDTITFNSSLNGQTITLSGPANDYAITVGDSAGVTVDASNLTNGLTIQGAGASGSFGLFQVSNGSSLTLRGLTLANGGGSAFASASRHGGAINSNGTLTLIGCTLSGNSAEAGGAIFNGGTLTLIQCTLTGNSATSSGGAIDSENILTVEQCTISGNSAGGIAGGIASYDNTFTLANSIVAGNTLSSGVASDIFVAYQSVSLAGTNLVGVIQGSVSGSGTVIHAAPVLAPLGSYGGPTQTMPPLLGSPAIDRGVNFSVPQDPVTGVTLSTDQRGKTRIQNNVVDIGAVETGGYIVRTAADDGSANSLRQLVTAANDITNTITFDPSLNGSTIPLNNIGVGLSLSANTAIDASALSGGITISGGGATRLFTVASNTIAVFNNLTLTGGNGAGTIFNGSGGAIYNSGGTITLNQCMLVGNAATGSGSVGGAFRQGVTGTLTLNRCTVANNTANATSGNAGGVAGGSGTLTLNQCTFFGNSTVGIGGAIAMAAGGGILNVNQCTISGNQAGISGGGLNNAGTLTLTNTIVTGNTSPKGADINNAGTLTLGGANLVQVISGTAPTGSGTYSSATPLLAPLGNYGGNTLTLALLQGSPALNAAVGSTFTTDQRGFAITDNKPDIGAYEAGDITNYNAWIYENLPATTSTNSAVHAASFDYDGDGVSNYNEFLAQTSPTDPTSYLHVTQTTRSGNNLSITFPSVLNRNYYVDGSTDLATWSLQEGPLAGTGSSLMRSYIVGSGTTPRFFLRVRVGP